MCIKLYSNNLHYIYNNISNLKTKKQNKYHKDEDEMIDVIPFDDENCLIMTKLTTYLMNKKSYEVTSMDSDDGGGSRGNKNIPKFYIILFIYMFFITFFLIFFNKLKKNFFFY